MRHFLWYGRMIEENAGCAWHALGCFTERNPKDEYTDKNGRVIDPDTRKMAGTIS